MTEPRHFLDLDRLETDTLRGILDLGLSFKAGTAEDRSPLGGKTLAMIFEKSSTRTRVSFEVGMRQLGGEVVVLSHTEMQIGRGETVADTARVLSRYVDAIMIRTDAPEKLAELAEYSSVPVINGLTDRSHPCQIMADVMTFEEHKGPIAGRIVAWSGDGNNVATSWIQAAARFDFELRLACPADLGPLPDVLDWARARGAKVSVTEDADAAIAGADCVVTDTWVSMGDESLGGDEGLGGDKGAADRHNMLKPFQVDERRMALAAADAIFMHCLPAHRGEEMTGGVIDGPQSVVWDEAENRLHAQKGILAWCLAG